MRLSEFLHARGSQSVLAEQVGCAPQLVWQWARGVRDVPPSRCAAIERATEGRVSCEELRPDVRWQRVPDAAWPHPAGRPCIDVAASLPAAEGSAAAHQAPEVPELTRRERAVPIDFPDRRRPAGAGERKAA